jgi:hypothetical protein
MTAQKLTVTGLYRPGWHQWPEVGQVAYLPLAGEWLAEAGFPVGTRVVVEVVEDGELVVRRVEEGETAEARWPAGQIAEAHDEAEREAAHA